MVRAVAVGWEVAAAAALGQKLGQALDLSTTARFFVRAEAA